MVHTALITYIQHNFVKPFFHRLPYFHLILQPRTHTNSYITNTRTRSWIINVHWHLGTTENLCFAENCIWSPNKPNIKHVYETEYACSGILVKAGFTVFVMHHFVYLAGCVVRHAEYVVNIRNGIVFHAVFLLFHHKARNCVEVTCFLRTTLTSMILERISSRQMGGDDRH
jgi:hypothetical protein